MSTGGRAFSAGDGRDGGQEFAEEFWSVVRVDNVRGSAAEVEFVEQFRYEGSSVAIGEGNQYHSLCETVN